MKILFGLGRCLVYTGLKPNEVYLIKEIWFEQLNCLLRVVWTVYLFTQKVVWTVYLFTQGGLNSYLFTQGPVKTGFAVFNLH